MRLFVLFSSRIFFLGSFHFDFEKVSQGKSFSVYTLCWVWDGFYATSQRLFQSFPDG